MTDLLVFLFFTQIISPNIFYQDNYRIIPPLGRIKSIAVTPFEVIAVNDDYLLIFDRNPFQMKSSFSFDQPIELVGFDEQYNEIWLSGRKKMLRFNTHSSILYEYMITEDIGRFGIAEDYIYVDGVNDYSIEKRTGAVKNLSAFPGTVKWFQKTGDTDLKKYPWLSPYVYFDDMSRSQVPNQSFPITAIADGGLEIFVGTDRYGLLKYNSISWQKERSVFGPLGINLRQVRRFEDKIYFISESGVSILPQGAKDWQYLRTRAHPSGFQIYKGTPVFGLRMNLFSFENGVSITLNSTPNEIIALEGDNNNLYIGTTQGMFALTKTSGKLTPFGPSKYSVYAIYPAYDRILSGGEFGLYSYDRNDKSWTQIMPFGIKDIVKFKDEYFLLGLNNQLIRYKPPEDISDADTNWVMLPYFNIYDIDADSDVVYCASYAGIYYFEPESELFKVIYNLPRIKYDHVFVVNQNILAVSSKGIFQLPNQKRD
ncbi:hypothetical protein A2Y85_06905 [candidate division WOR-3 bacterium RBG_13_43_14]|uniref:Uncharacterized protein n=1 Tax=candidate division WOR-3 bacterium RBG_13_43_14 TaxID=1802590 RepID=A0A1F4UAL9_UNCW3|nr:MAG: hypothetical protein A2Y85_06905 [candidate division WOR-3 bacterium RBG_13_43_14]